MSDGYDGHTLVAKDREIAALRERVAELQAETGYVDAIAAVRAEAMSPAVQKAMERFHAKLAERREKEAAEGMRAKCEAMLRAEAQKGDINEDTAFTLNWAADAIAALKGNGKPISSP
jgi:hypothetical protein